MKKKYIFILIFILIIADQLTKILVSKLNSPLVIINNFLKFEYIENTGAAFGILSGNIFLIVIITLALLGYLVYDMRTKLNSKLDLISYVLIISGSIGNLIDRICYKYVRDFISFKIFGLQMAIFNLADIFITFGIILYIFILVRNDVNERNNSR